LRGTATSPPVPSVTGARKFALASRSWPPSQRSSRSPIEGIWRARGPVPIQDVSSVASRATFSLSRSCEPAMPRSPHTPNRFLRVTRK
jgi:hypothetical protein